MKYTVVYTSLADDLLAEIWLHAPNRQQVADASDLIQSSLKQDAHLQGQEHPNGWKVIAVPPLVATFRVSPDDRKVTVLAMFYRP
jgi:hypothetical protein